MNYKVNKTEASIVAVDGAADGVEVFGSFQGAKEDLTAVLKSQRLGLDRVIANVRHLKEKDTHVEAMK